MDLDIDDLMERLLWWSIGVLTILLFAFLATIDKKSGTAKCPRCDGKGRVECAPLEPSSK